MQEENLKLNLHLFLKKCKKKKLVATILYKVTIKIKIYDYITKENIEQQNPDLPGIPYILNINNLRLWFLKRMFINTGRIDLRYKISSISSAW